MRSRPDAPAAAALPGPRRLRLTIWQRSVLTSYLFLLPVYSRWTVAPGLFRAIVFFPLLASGAAVAQIWGYILLPGQGLLGYAFHLVGLPDVKWLTDPAAAPIAVALITVWHGVGFQTL